MLEGKDVFMNGDGLSSRDFCYIENVVQANILAAFSTEEANGKVFNIAVGERTTLIELFEILKNSVEKITGKKVAPAMMRSFREGDIPHSLASIEMAQKVLQYQPVIKIGHGLLETVKKSIKI